MYYYYWYYCCYFMSCIKCLAYFSNARQKHVWLRRGDLCILECDQVNMARFKLTLVTACLGCGSRHMPTQWSAHRTHTRSSAPPPPLSLCVNWAFPTEHSPKHRHFVNGGARVEMSLDYWSCNPDAPRLLLLLTGHFSSMNYCCAGWHGTWRSGSGWWADTFPEKPLEMLRCGNSPRAQHTVYGLSLGYSGEGLNDTEQDAPRSSYLRLSVPISIPVHFQSLRGHLC